MKTLTRVLGCVVFGFIACSSEPAQKPETVDDQPTASAEPRSSKVQKSPEEYSLSVNPKLLSNGDAQLVIRSDIPGVIEVMAEISLEGQKEDDVWVGKDRRVRLVNGEGETKFSTSELPSGMYEAKVSFYPSWGPQDATSRATGIAAELSASSTLNITGSGASAIDVQFKENSQKWVMENVFMGYPWRPTEWIEKFGQYEELTVESGNPKILKAYYFPRIDTTLIVNTLKGEITVWRLGRAHR